MKGYRKLSVMYLYMLISAALVVWAGLEANVWVQSTATIIIAFMGANFGEAYSARNNNKPTD